MTHEEYVQAGNELLQYADQIQESKRPGYVMGNADVLHNFKAVAARVGITPEQAWAVYALKHMDAIISIMAKPELPVSEAPLGRFSDLVNYAQLGWALLCERQNAEGLQGKDPSDRRG